jgi:perosamine synthetase
MHALDLKAGDEVIVPPITFAATANAVIYGGGTPVFADVEQGSLLIDPAKAAEKINERTRGIVAVDYAGQPCDYDELRALAARHGLALAADACHTLGARYKQQMAGCLAEVSAFSFHPVKSITTGEGGMITTDNADIAKRIRNFRNHGITTDHRQRALSGAFTYDMVELGYNYRITDLQCALGASQLTKLPGWIERRRQIASHYDELLEGREGIRPLKRLPERSHVYHLYVVEVDGGARDRVFERLRESGIGCNVHYRPVYLHPYYRERFGYREGLCPVAEAAYERILSLPIFPAMTDTDVERVVDELRKAMAKK